jgi:type IV secretory pathway VirB2 component (pilin)
MSTRNVAETQRSIAAANQRAGTQHIVWSALALLTLVALCLLSLAPTVQPTLADRLTFLLLAITGAVCFWTRGSAFFEERADAATFAVTLAMFVVYGLARQALPDTGWTMNINLLPDTPQTLPVAGLVAIAGAVFTAPLWWRNRNGWTRALLAAIVVVAVLGTAMFWFLGRYYTVGETEVLDPTPLVRLLMQTVEFAALALVCSAACALTATRRILLRVLPVVLLALWARHQFFPAPIVEEAE